MMAALIPVFSEKLSIVRIISYYGGRTHWNPECCSFCCHHLIFSICTNQALTCWIHDFYLGFTMVVVVISSLCWIFWFDCLSAQKWIYILLITGSSISQVFGVWQCWECTEDFLILLYMNIMILIAENNYWIPFYTRHTRTNMTGEL